MSATGRPAVRAFDQADGLRRLFAASRVCFVPLVSNPHVAFGGVMIDQLAAAYAECGAHVLVVDAAEHSPAPHELTQLELRMGLESLSPRLTYLAARGLSLRHVDATGSTAAFLEVLAQAAPQADVIVVHAGAAELARLFAQRAARGLLLASDHPAAVTQAYASMKVLSQRARMQVFDLLIGAAATSPRTERIAEHLAGCADQFLNVLLRDWAAVDPAVDLDEPPCAALRRLARDTLMPERTDPAPLDESMHDHPLLGARVVSALN